MKAAQWAGVVSRTCVAVWAALLLVACANAGSPILTSPSPVENDAFPAATSSDIIAEPSPTPPPIVSAQTRAIVDLSVELPETIHLLSGETASYPLTIRNLSSAPATQVVLTSTLPASLLPLWIQPAARSCERQGRDIVCAFGEVQSGDQLSVTLDLSASEAQNPLSDTQLSGAELSVTTFACHLNDDSTPGTIICRVSELPPGAEAKIYIGIGAETDLQEELAWTASVAANETDPNPANNLATTSILISAEPTEPVPAADLTLAVGWPATVFAGQPFTYFYTITNQSTVDASGVVFENPLPPDLDLVNYAPALPRCEQQDSLLTCSIRDPDSGDVLTFDLTITGHESQPLLIWIDPLMSGWPACMVLWEGSAQYLLHCEFGALPAGDSTHVQVALLAPGVRERTVTNNASVHADGTDQFPQDNTITTTLFVQVQSDLLVRSSHPSLAVAGEALTYTLYVTNQGPSDADKVVLDDRLPEGSTFLSAITSRGGQDCHLEADESPEGTVICNLGFITGTETVAVTITVSVNADQVEALTHYTDVRAGTFDPNLDDNQLTETIPVQREDGSGAVQKCRRAASRFAGYRR